MSKLFFSSVSFLTLIALAGCSDSKNAAYFKKHPHAIVPSAIQCTQLPLEKALKNKMCLAIAAVEKPDCERELQVKGMLFMPNGGLASCDDNAYLIARPVIEAKMEAYLEGKPDPVAVYLKNHPH